MVVDDGVRGHKSLGDHFVLEFDCLLELAVIDQTLSEDSPCAGGGRKEGVVLEEETEVLEGDAGPAAVTIGLDQEVEGDDGGSDVGLGNEAVEGEEIGMAGLEEEGAEDGVGGEDGRLAIGEDGVANEGSGLI